ncbi:hypothetical protein [Agriterribacter sp.]|uniref:hypothetical protein n=1 Tax=Agriterribacter sp. TaxID=2821509 RepID=UPI002B55D835|nr:hypothetical protein [Agriterribacter sp.]HTN09302.1 hypothetical protein [Agriterribacter sp.]
MRKQIVFIGISFFVLGSHLQAQQKVLPKPVFHSLEQIALVNGNNAVSGALQTVNGLAYGNWFAGIGAGIDFYRYRSVPLFLDLRRYFDVKKGNKLFVYADGGYNLPWTKSKDPVFSIWGWPSKTNYTYKGGAYMDAGFGYAVHVKGGNAFLLSTGYSHKYFSEQKTTTTVTAENMETVDIQKFTYSMNRLMIKLGWQF